MLLIHLDQDNPLKKKSNNLTRLKQVRHIRVDIFKQKLYMQPITAWIHVYNPLKLFSFFFLDTKILIRFTYVIV